MSVERLARAISRIEAATDRIEAGASRPLAADPELADKYQRLRGETGAALADLDRLIEKLAS